MRHLLSVLALILGSALSARAEDFKIDRYHVEITVDQESVLDVTEEIDVTFFTPRHGIFRDIPYRYSVPGDAIPYTTLLYDISVRGDPQSVSTQGNYTEIKIGSADEYVSGRHHYTIHYKVFGAIRFYKNGPELYWNVIGDRWPVTIANVSFHIEFPERYDLTPEKYYAVAGLYGSRGGPVSYSWNGSSLTGYTTRELTPREAVTAAVQPPIGSLADGSPMLRIRWLFATYGLFAIPAVVFVVLCGVWFLFGKDEEMPEMVFFKPPENFTAAESGVIIDDKVDNRDLTALIVEWATKGYLSIKEEEVPGFVTVDRDYLLEKLRDLPVNSRSYEHTIFNGLFSGRSSVFVSSLKEHFYTVMKDARGELNTVIEDLQLYAPGTRAAASGLKAISAIAIFLSFWFALSAHNILYLVAGALSAFIILFFASIMPKKTEVGQKQYQHVRGFRQFMKRVQVPQLEMLLKTDPQYFDKTIAYAMVFGFAAEWCSRFEGLLASPPDWFYAGPGRFNSFNTFGTSLDRSFTSMNSAFLSTPAPQGGSGFSSGGGGGGGFSGGGFGGGGGGSW